jgi:hypothetical protein
MDLMYKVDHFKIQNLPVHLISGSLLYAIIDDQDFFFQDFIICKFNFGVIMEII